MKYIIATLSCLFMVIETVPAQSDPYLWLENVDDPKALAFVETLNGKTEARLKALPIYDKIYSKSLEILNSNNRIAAPAIRGEHIYNFWRDKDHVRGIWRRSPKQAYLAGQPVWETLLDIDALSEKDNIKWVYLTKASRMKRVKGLAGGLPSILS
ncbi:MAG: hypothetical protein MUE58_02910 [Chitinophagaceae bacterium]|nr:hypothetical protein [Chitinophagaceae bacterium]